MNHRAVLLGGGGVTGIAWATGVVKGLLDHGVLLTDADAVIGTSAGAFVGAHLAGDVVDEAYRAQLDGRAREIAANMTPELVEQYQEAISMGVENRDVTGRMLGALARRAGTVSPAEREEVVRSRLHVRQWPSNAFRVTAIDADSGELCLLGADAGINLVTALAASGAVPGMWPHVAASGHMWIDGGCYSSANVELGRGFDSVVVIAPMTEGFAGQRSTHTEVDELTAAGTNAILVSPDRAGRTAIGDNPFDPVRRVAAAKAGRVQGMTAAGRIAALWGHATLPHRSSTTEARSTSGGSAPDMGLPGTRRDRARRATGVGPDQKGEQ